MKSILFTVLAVCSFVAAPAQDAERVVELEQKIRNLEERIAKLEKDQQTPEAKKMARAARARDAADRKKFKSADIAKAEALYQKAAQTGLQDWNKVLLDSVVKRYPQLNRAGCAQLYRAQQEMGEEKVRLLKDCMKRFYNCYYFDGAQVGPLAMYQLAAYYRSAGKKAEADKLFRQISLKCTESVDHTGALLIDKMDL